MRVFRAISLSLVTCALTATSAFGDVFLGDGRAYGLPYPIDVEMERSRLSGAFPQMEIGVDYKKRDVIEKFRRDLDRFVKIDLESLNQKILDNCTKATGAEKLVNMLGRENQIRKSERDEVLREVEAERELCLVANYETSKYWQLYDDFLKLYRARDVESWKELEGCISKNRCRDRQD